MKDGFFTSQVWTAKKTPLPTIPSCEACGLYRHCTSPKMPYFGQGRRKVLIVAEAPGEQEDFHGRPLVGNAGREIARQLDAIGVNMLRDCWLTNAIICRPFDVKGNRAPTATEIDHCRPNLSRTLNELKPTVIICLGKWATQAVIEIAWKAGEVKDITRWVGWNIPSVKLNAWICPTYHPAFLLRSKEETSDFSISGRTNPVVELWMLRHLRAAFQYNDKPWPTRPAWDSQCEIVFDETEAAQKVWELSQSGAPLAFDFETTTLKPDGRHAQILCCSVSDGAYSICFPWYGEPVKLMRELIRSDVQWIAANLRFEDRWCRTHLGRSVKNWCWDTLLGAHAYDCKRGICSLKFQSFVLLGTEDYNSHIEPYMKAETSNTLNRLREVEPSVLMKYCSKDSLFETLVAYEQARLMGMSL